MTKVTQREVLDWLIAHIGEHALPDGAPAIYRYSTFESMGLDSLDIVELIMYAEEKWPAIEPVLDAAWDKEQPKDLDSAATMMMRLLNA